MGETIFPAIFSVQEAAVYLRTSRRNIYALFKKGELRLAKVGGRTLVRRSDIDALIERSLSAGPAYRWKERGNAKDEPISSAGDGVFA